MIETYLKGFGEIASANGTNAPEWARSLKLSAITRFEALGFPTTWAPEPSTFSPPSFTLLSGASPAVRRTVAATVCPTTAPPSGSATLTSSDALGL